MELNQILEQRWRETIPGSYNATQLYIDDFPLEIYIGFDANQNKCLMLKSTLSFHELPSSVAIGYSLVKQTDGSFLHVISLLQSNQEGIFLTLCGNILSTAIGTNSELAALKQIERRYKQWQQLFKRANDKLLSKEEQQGLLGELLFLKNLLEKKSQPYIAILKGWHGPEYDHKDFRYGDDWFEIKTIKEGVTSIKITSVEQLDAETDGILVVYTLYTADKDTTNAKSLYKIYHELLKILQDDGDAMMMFINKMNMIGWEDRKEYDEDYFTSRFTSYDVNDSFPRISLKKLPEQVEKVTYTLSLNSLESWHRSDA